MANVWIDRTIFNATIDWANQHRARKGWAPIKEFEAGIPRDPRSNPLAVATGMEIFSDAQLPRRIKQFMTAFDNQAPNGVHRPVKG